MLVDFGKLDLDVVDGLEEAFVGVFEDVLGCNEHVWLEDVDARRHVSIWNDSSQNSKASYTSAAKRTYASSTTQTTLAWPPASDKPFKVSLPTLKTASWIWYVLVNLHSVWAYINCVWDRRRFKSQ
jgi:hypothetical protein